MTLRNTSEVMKQASPLFIMGTKRSGTSIVYRTMQKHSFFRPKETDLTESAIVKMAAHSYRFNGRQPWQLIDFMLKDQTHYRQFLRDIAPLQRFQKTVDAGRLLSRTSHRLGMYKTVWWYLVQSHLVVRSFFYHAQRARSCARMVEKTPHNTEYIPQILHTFPNARLLCLVRHPVDVYSSRQRRGRMAGSAGGNLLMSQEEFCQVYQEFASTVLKAAQQYPQAIKLIQFEAFTSEPAATFQDICTFLNIPFEEEAIIENKPDPERWKPDPLLFGPIVAQTKAWRDYVSEAEAQHIEKTLAPAMTTLGYERYTA